MPLNLTAVAPGTTLGRYRLLESIGAGGMGEVWRARDANLDRDVAIKFLRSGMSVGTDTRERFRREALVLSRLSHPGVATVFDFDSRDGVDFLVMEYVRGGSQMFPESLRSMYALTLQRQGKQREATALWAESSRAAQRDLADGREG